MSTTNASSPRRTRVERGIYRSISGKLEVCYTDSDGRTRFETQSSPNITAARERRATFVARRAAGEVVRPNPRLRFGEAREAWLEREVAALRPRTQETYAGNSNLLPWTDRRLDSLTVSDVSDIVRDLRAREYSEWTIAGAIKAASAIFKFSRRELRWAGDNPVADLSRAQRPKPSQTPRRRLHSAPELEATLAATGDQWKALLALIATTGVRESEALALRWCDIQEDYAKVGAQLSRATRDRPAERVAPKTAESEREVPLVREVVRLLTEQKLRSRHTAPDDFVFATATGAPVSQRNLLRELDRAQRAAIDERGEPVFRTVDEAGQKLSRREAALPHIHDLRHTFASTLVADGESVDEVAWTLGHKDGRTTRAVYVHELRTTEQRDRRLARAERNVKWMESANRSPAQQDTSPEPENLLFLGLAL